MIIADMYREIEELLAEYFGQKIENRTDKTGFNMRFLNGINRMDVLVIASVIVKMSTVFLTAFFFTLTATITQASIENAVVAMERNVMINLLAKLQGTTAIMLMLMPALMFTIYFIFRTRLKDKPHLIEFYVYFIVFSTVANFMNDLGTVVALLIKAGLV